MPTVAEYASNALRGVVVAAPGRKLLVADLANIEGRVVAWAAGEQWKLDAYRAFDAGVGPDLYKVTYGRTFGVDANFDHKTIQGYQWRQIGKVMELMLGYGGGVAAIVTGSETYHFDLGLMAPLCWPSIPRDLQLDAEGAWWYAVKEERTLGLTKEVYCACDGVKRLWRRNNPNIEGYWEQVEWAATTALTSSAPVVAGPLEFDRVDAWLRMRLPAGGYLCYPGAHVAGGKLTFLGVNPYTKQWGRIKTWGGTLVENATQAIARDVLAQGMLNAEAAGLPVVLHVHDEAVCEVPDDPRWSVDLLEVFMIDMPEWAQGLPLAAHGFETDRYHKSD